MARIVTMINPRERRWKDGSRVISFSRRPLCVKPIAIRWKRFYQWHICICCLSSTMERVLFVYRLRVYLLVTHIPLQLSLDESNETSIMHIHEYPTISSVRSVHWNNWNAHLCHVWIIELLQTMQIISLFMTTGAQQYNDETYARAPYIYERCKHRLGRNYF